jgi:hypothetical protein
LGKGIIMPRVTEVNPRKEFERVLGSSGNKSNLLRWDTLFK